MTNNRDNGQPAPFAFRLTADKLRECRDMTAEEKLRWLEEANAFVRKFVSPDRLARWARLVEGRDDPNGADPKPLPGESAST